MSHGLFKGHVASDLPTWRPARRAPSDAYDETYRAYSLVCYGGIPRLRELDASGLMRDLYPDHEPKPLSASFRVSEALTYLLDRLF